MPRARVQSDKKGPLLVASAADDLFLVVDCSKGEKIRVNFINFHPIYLGLEQFLGTRSEKRAP